VTIRSFPRNPWQKAAVVAVAHPFVSVKSAAKAVAVAVAHPIKSLKSVARAVGFPSPAQIARFVA
jgi:hypothetical protein